MGPEYIYERSEWPKFHYDLFRLAPALAEVRTASGALAAKLASLGLNDRSETQLSSTVSEIGDSSAIEGERLDLVSVRSSVARQLGFDVAGLPLPDRSVEGVVAMAIDATKNFRSPLTAERLFGWHAALFPTGRSGFFTIRVGGWRDDQRGPMQVVSGPMGQERVHFQAPDSERVTQEMEVFLEWYEGDDGTEGFLKAAIAHLWFLTIHPFDDGNGRIGRAILDMSLARAENEARRGYSISSGILRRQEAYYAILEQTQKSDLEITPYLAWYLALFRDVLDAAESTLARSLMRSRFWQRADISDLNSRQRGVLTRFLGEFEGKLSNAKWTKLTGASHDTALRDLNDLVERGLLVRTGEGRGARYELAPENEPLGNEPIV